MNKGILALMLLMASGGAIITADAPDISVKQGTSITAASETGDTAMEKKTVSADTVKFYKYWKKRYLKKDTYVKDASLYYVCYADKDSEEYRDEYKDAKAPPVTVSEAHGYGMLITVSMADYDKDAKAIFDGLYEYYLAHRSSIGKNLMSWQQGDNGTALVETNDGEITEEPDSATDGDMDIAYALLMADAVWGSDWEIDYKAAAVDIINDIMTYEVSHTDWILKLGDWTYGVPESSKYYSATRSSDFIMQYMPAFYRATGDKRWMKVYKSTYKIINDIVDEYDTGILPDFIVKDKKSGKFIPAPAEFLESENDGNYYYNACRTPWRIGMDGIINNNSTAKKFSRKINECVKTAADGDPWSIMAGYDLNGKAVSDWNDLCFDAPFMITASCAGDKEWHDKVRSMVLEYDDDVYYGDTISMLCLIVDDGGWIEV